MKLLMTADAVGGVWTYAVDLAGALLTHGVETVIAVLGPPPSGDQRAMVPAGVTLRDTGLPLDWLADGAAAVRDAAGRLAVLAREIDADLMQVNSPSLAGAASFPCPVVAVAHGCIGTWWEAAEGTSLPDDLAWQAAMIGDGLAAADVVVAPSAAYAAVVQRRYGLAHPPLVVHNGRTPAVRIASPELAHHAFTAGRLWDRVKNTTLLDAVAARLTTPFLAAGPVTAPQGETILLEHLEPLGTVDADELARRLAARPVFVSAASFEPFGLAVLEAAQAGCALILSDIQTFRELWDGAALFVPGWDADDWAGVIERLSADPTRRAELGRAAAARAARYTPEATAGSMAHLYAGLLPRHRRVA